MKSIPPSHIFSICPVLSTSTSAVLSILTELLHVDRSTMNIYSNFCHFHTKGSMLTQFSLSFLSPHIILEVFPI